MRLQFKLGHPTFQTRPLKRLCLSRREASYGLFSPLILRDWCEMQTTRNKTPWESHAWKVKTLESVSPDGGSKLAYTCRSCERKFTFTTANNRAWATNARGTALADDITARWLTENCLRRPGEHDHKDVHKLKNPVKSDASQ